MLAGRQVDRAEHGIGEQDGRRLTVHPRLPVGVVGVGQVEEGGRRRLGAQGHVGGAVFDHLDLTESGGVRRGREQGEAPGGAGDHQGSRFRRDLPLERDAARHVEAGP